MTMKVAFSNAEEITLEATVIRADGTVEYLGEVAYWHRNPLKRFWVSVRNFFRR